MALQLSLYNTLTHKVEGFQPLDPARVRLYVCGPTVYDYAHIGNARPVVVFDVLFRLLRMIYGLDQVTYARNITDVDDKIIDAAHKTGEAITSITTRTTAWYHDDMAALGALPPTLEPRATQHIGSMIAMIEGLIAGGYAYVNAGHVLFDTPSYPAYGQLSRRKLDEMIAGARVEVAPYKKNATDFVLWKPSDPDDPGWESPWGRGRPGWHIECSAMSAAHLGPQFDIHGGGSDLIFPHHENEMAQSACAHGGTLMARYWMHNGHVIVEGQKMSKSLGNFVTVHDLLDKHRGEVLRLALLRTHYRDPLDWTARGLAEAETTLCRLYRALQVPYEPVDVAAADNPIFQALADDLNTPLALTHMQAMAHCLFQETAPVADKNRAGSMLRDGAAVMGLLTQDPASWFQGDMQDACDIEAMIAARQQARQARDFATADRIRKDLEAMGITLEDGAGGTKWRRI